MARKDFPWHASDMKFGNNVVFNLILLLLVPMYYIIVGIIYLVMTFAEFTGLKKSHKTSSLTHETEGNKSMRKGQNPTPNNGRKWLGLIISIILPFGILLGLHIKKSSSLPITINYTRYYRMSDDSEERLFDKLYYNRACDVNPIFWETPINWRMTKYQLIKSNIPSTHIVVDGKEIQADIKYGYSYNGYDGKLETIQLKIPYDTELEKFLINHYGEKYIHIVNNRRRLHDSNKERYFYVWVIDACYVVLERIRADECNDYIYVKIGLRDIFWHKNVRGAYFSTHIPNHRYGAYADSVVHLSFQNIVLGEHIDKSLTQLKGNPNVKDLCKCDSSTYRAKIIGLVPEDNSLLHFDSKLTYYKDTLVQILISSNDKKATSYTSLYKEKYDINKGHGGSSISDNKTYEVGGAYHRAHIYYKWDFRNQSISISEWAKVYDSNYRHFVSLDIEYIHSTLFEEMKEKESFNEYEKRLEEKRRMRMQEIEDSINLAMKKNKASELI